MTPDKAAETWAARDWEQRQNPININVKKKEDEFVLFEEPPIAGTSRAMRVIVSSPPRFRDKEEECIVEMDVMSNLVQLYTN